MYHNLISQTDLSFKTHQRHKKLQKDSKLNLSMVDIYSIIVSRCFVHFITVNTVKQMQIGIFNSNSAMCFVE